MLFSFTADRKFLKFEELQSFVSEHNVARRPTDPKEIIQIDNKTMQWFGATVSTSFQDGGPILVSRWKFNCILVSLLIPKDPSFISRGFIKEHKRHENTS